ncbi:MAG: hypothetical protein V4697_00475 [Patescibacteria group bacterium]
MKNSNKRGMTTIGVVVMVVLIVGNIFFATMWIKSNSKLKVVTASREAEVAHATFMVNFIEKVLKTENEVAFEDRLKLENEVRALDNKEVFDQWKKFVESETPTIAQVNLKDLLASIARSIQVEAMR